MEINMKCKCKFGSPELNWWRHGIYKGISKTGKYEFMEVVNKKRGKITLLKRKIGEIEKE